MRPGQAVLRRVIGFVVGFAAAIAIIVATETSRNAADERADGNFIVVGIPDVFGFCRANDAGLEAALRSNDAYGWACVGRRNGIWGFEGIDLTEACRLQFGPSSTAATDDPDSPYGWTCVVPA